MDNKIVSSKCVFLKWILAVKRESGLKWFKGDDFFDWFDTKVNEHL